MKGLTKTSSGAIVAEGPGVELWQMLAAQKALQVEVDTGLRHSRGSVLKFVQQKYGIKARTKRKAIEEMQAIIDKFVEDNSE